jgi:spore maturation protein CgeB
MKILISGSKHYAGLPMSYLRAFQKLGCEVEIFGDEEFYWQDKKFLKNRYTHRFFWKIFARKTNEEFIKKTIEYKPDLILVFKGWFYSPKTIKKIKELLPNVKSFCYNQENPFNTNWFTQFSYSNDWVVKSIAHFDAYFTWGRFLIEKIKKEGKAKNVYHLPFGCDPDIHYPVKVPDEEKNIYGSDIAFIGTYSKDREDLLNSLLDYDLKIWGNGWQKANKKLQEKWQRKDVYGEEFSKICNASKIVLDILRPQMLPSHSMKTFEIPACKGFLMQSRGGEVYDFFEEGKEIVTFSTPEELKEKMDFYLKNDELREKIREAGYQKVKNNTYFERAKKVLEVFNHNSNDANVREYSE